MLWNKVRKKNNLLSNQQVAPYLDCFTVLLFSVLTQEKVELFTGMCAWPHPAQIHGGENSGNAAIPLCTAGLWVSSLCAGFWVQADELRGVSHMDQDVKGCFSLSTV